GRIGVEMEGRFEGDVGEDLGRRVKLRGMLMSEGVNKRKGGGSKRMIFGKGGKVLGNGCIGKGSAERGYKGFFGE
uniref:hypothetical protein n=1 Tax=Paenibacillus xylanexedens TaxID=528191 RepID=UPI001C930740